MHGQEPPEGRGFMSSSAFHRIVFLKVLIQACSRGARCTAWVIKHNFREAVSMLVLLSLSLIPELRSHCAPTHLLPFANCMVSASVVPRKPSQQTQ
jgi:hypothetical protein